MSINKYDSYIIPSEWLEPFTHSGNEYQGWYRSDTITEPNIATTHTLVVGNETGGKIFTNDKVIINKKEFIVGVKLLGYHFTEFKLMEV